MLLIFCTPSFAILVFYVNLCCIRFHSHFTLEHHSLIDPVFVSSPSHLLACSIKPPLTNSDHYGRHIQTNSKSAGIKIPFPSKENLALHTHVHFASLFQRISLKLTGMLFSLITLIPHGNYGVIIFYRSCIPKRVLSPCRHNLPWLDKRTVQAIQCRDTLFRRVKKSCKHQDHAKYCRARSRFVSQLHNAKTNYFHKLNPSNPKQFWRQLNSSLRSLQMFQLSLMMKICMILTWIRQIF